MFNFIAEHDKENVECKNKNNTLNNCLMWKEKILQVIENALSVIIGLHVQRMYSCNASYTDKIKVSLNLSRRKSEQRTNTHTLYNALLHSSVPQN